MTAPAAPGNHVPGRILLGAGPQLERSALNMLLEKMAAREVHQIQPLRIHILQVSEDRWEQTLDQLRRHPQVAFAEADSLVEPALVPSDSYVSYQWYLPTIAAAAAWDATRGSESVVLAVLDSGVDPTHPELAGKLVAGWNFYDNNADTTDHDGHGTAVAGIAAAATDNASGIAGVGWSTRLMPIRITDPNGFGSLSAMANALVFAADNGVRVANISYAVSGSPTVTTAAQYFHNHGGVVTVASGNAGGFDSTPDNPYVLTISATTSTDGLASFSNTGNNIDLAAPGETILTTALGGAYANGTGTSFAAPIVAGVAALAIAANPNLSGADLQQVLKDSADDRGAVGWDTSFGWGRVNAAAAVAAALNFIPDQTPPTARITSPATSATVAGLVNVAIAATDDQSVSRIELLLDGLLLSTTTANPAQITWDSSQQANGSHQLVAKAYDAAGHVGQSDPVYVTVQNVVADTAPPSATISSPAPGTKVAQKQKVLVQAVDNIGVARIDLLADGKLVGSSTTCPASFTWNTSSLAKGQHVLQAKAYDAAGNVGGSPIVAVSK